MDGKPPPSRVLVADDSVGVAERLCSALRDGIANVELIGPAHDGHAALTLFDQADPEAVVLDLHMPRLDGLGVLRAIRARGRRCLVIMLTNDIEPAIRERCIAEGADHFLRKSHDFEQMIELVRSWLGLAEP